MDETVGMASGDRRVIEPHDVFLSYSRNDLEPATLLLGQLEKAGLKVFRDQDSIREGDLWLNKLQAAVDACGSFVVLVGRDGVRRWIGAETQVALSRHFGPHNDAERLPIFPVLLSDTSPETLPAFLRLFQSASWDGRDALPDRLVEQIRERTSLPNDRIAFEGCPFVGLDAYRPDQAHLFFGRQKETLDALACFDTRPGAVTVRWLEINGNSGSGKSSLMNAGLLPLVDQGWLWPRTGFEHWRRIGPMMPGERPVLMLAEHLARALKKRMTDVRRDLEGDDERALADWLRGEKPDEQTAFLLAIDQFEEVFTFADRDERLRFDRLLAAALDDPDCPLFVISTVRSDFLDRFDELLPRLVAVRNRSGKSWTLPLISEDGLREIVAGPARLAGLDVSEIREVMVAEARDEPGALPLVQNALRWLWEQRTGNRLSGQLLIEKGGVAGILSHNADALLRDLGPERGRALELLFRLVNVDPEGRQHTRQRMPLAEAVAVAGGADRGRSLIDRLAGTRARDDPKAKGALRLITVTEERENPGSGEHQGGWVNLIHETLIRSKGLGADGKPQPYWPTLWHYIEQNKDRAARRERLQLQAREWANRKGLARLFGLAGWSGMLPFRGLATPGTVEQRYLRWSATRSLVEIVLVAAVTGVLAEALYWKTAHAQPLEAVWTRWAYLLGRDLPLPDDARIPPGDVQLPDSFMMGSDTGDDDERPVHEVTFGQPFYMSTTEVTVGEYAAFASATGRRIPPDSGFKGTDRPVINVDWSDARGYARWLGAMTGRECRLPSEAQWEYACRAGTTTEYALPAPDGSDDIAGQGLANCADCGSQWDGQETAPVGQFPANAWGLHDMHGNVREWGEDCWHEGYEDAPEDGGAWLAEDDGDCAIRVVRGGSWYPSHGFARCAHRLNLKPSNRYNDVGFRVVCSQTRRR